MAKLTIPKHYKSALDVRGTEKGIKLIKDYFETKLAEALNLERVSAPLFVEAGTGVNDDLNGVERKASFEIHGAGCVAEGLFSLAKWKRMKLAEYGFGEGEGLYTDMNAIRCDDVLDNLHSAYADQWDWEKVISKDQRNLSFLEKTVRAIYGVIKATGRMVQETYPQLKHDFPSDIVFIHAEELFDKYPDLTSRQREDKAAKEYGAIFIIGIGGKLPDGTIHDGRAPDYDDWITENGKGYKGLNGDIVVHYPLLDTAFELSSMGIRVNKEAMLEQLKIRDCEERTKQDWHKRLLAGEFPQTIGGGIGQSRLCMLLLQKAHIGEVQSSVWPDEVEMEFKRKGVALL